MLNRRQTRNLVSRYFHKEGWLPAGTNPSQWASVAMADIDFDDPPLPGDPHLQKKRVALDLQNLFFMLGSKLASPLAQLRSSTGTLGDFADWCFENQD